MIGIALPGCTALVSLPKASLPPQDPAPKVEVPDESIEKPSPGASPRALASLRLTDQGRILLDSGRPDDAIRILEQAVSLNPNNGQNYYYLSAAWLLKGNTAQAREFNHLAGIYLKGDAEWMRRVMDQKEQIRKHKK
jgi:tetratricopeptide (TPR) repeat protein